MKHKNYIFKFKGGNINVSAFGYKEAEILAQAEAIKNAWDYTIISYEEIKTQDELRQEGYWV